jgi:coenzyme F420-reducing hydrogenase beta subunit
MYKDKEGFYYPKVDDYRCIQCESCLNNCPTECERIASERKDAYIGFCKDDSIRNLSSSGGLFYELAKSTINERGVVYGANFEPDFSVKHKRVDSLEELNVLLTSKYVQSDTSGIFHSLIEDLKSGKTVLFAGTPCQVAAAYNTAMQKKLTDNLVLVDFICHGVPSPAIWKSYLEFICKKDISIESVNFRNKSHGWHDYHLYIRYNNKSCLRQSHELNAYMRSFLSDQNLRPSCYSCNYKKDNYAADITLGDAWKVEKDYPIWADNKGTSLIIVRRTKGKELLENVTMNFVCRETNYEQWTIYNPSLVSATVRPENREVLFNAYHNTDNQTFWKFQKKVPFVKHARYQVKQFLRKTGLEKTVRRFH